LTVAAKWRFPLHKIHLFIKVAKLLRVAEFTRNAANKSGWNQFAAGNTLLMKMAHSRERGRPARMSATARKSVRQRPA
jgi:hypothetical protein